MCRHGPSKVGQNTGYNNKTSSLQYIEFVTVDLNAKKKTLCGKKSFWALNQLQQEQSRVKKGFTLFQILVT